MNKRQLLRATALVASSLWLAGTASAQDFPPKKPVTLVVGFAAGGAADAAARLIAKKLGENGREHVRQNFLLTRHLRDYLLLFLSLYHSGDVVNL